MTFDQAFDRAATLAKAITVDESVSSYFGSGCGLAEGKFRKRRIGFAPTADERVKAIEGARLYIAGVWGMTKTLPEAERVRNVVRQRVGFGPLTWLWIAVMVAQLLAALKHLLQEPAGQEKC